MKSIAIGLSPNTQGDDVWLAVKTILAPLSYKKGEAVIQLERWFRDYFSVPYAITFQNARSALFAILTSLHVRPGDEVIMQAFTCIVVANPLIALGVKPVYVDITEEITMDPKDLEKKITTKTRAIIVQHTFGIASPMDEIMRIANKHHVPVIEDVAHTIGGEIQGKKLGTFGIASIFSFGRDKAFSSVFGGVAITQDKTLGKAIRAYQKQKSYPSFRWIAQQLVHPIAFAIILPTYDMLSFGKAILVILQRLGILSFPVAGFEKKGKFYPSAIRKMPNALARLAMHQLKKIDVYNARRVKIGDVYQKTCRDAGIAVVTQAQATFLRFPILTDEPKRMRDYFRQKGKVYLGDWYANVFDPVKSDLSVILYTKGMCPNAENYAAHIVNLPTIPTMTERDVARVVSLLKNYDTHQRNNK